MKPKIGNYGDIVYRNAVALFDFPRGEAERGLFLYFIVYGTCTKKIGVNRCSTANFMGDKVESWKVRNFNFWLRSHHFNTNSVLTPPIVAVLIFYLMPLETLFKKVYRSLIQRSHKFFTGKRIYVAGLMDIPVSCQSPGRTFKAKTKARRKAHQRIHETKLDLRKHFCDGFPICQSRANFQGTLNQEARLGYSHVLSLPCLPHHFLLKWHSTWPHCLSHEGETN